MCRTVNNYNDEVEKINAAKRLLDKGIPKIYRRASTCGTYPTVAIINTDKDNKISGVTVRSQQLSSQEICVCEARALAAAIIALTGPITEEDLKALTIE